MSECEGIDYGFVLAVIDSSHDRIKALRAFVEQEREAAQSVAQRDEAEKGRLWLHLRDRCERAEADLADMTAEQARSQAHVAQAERELADEKRRHGELRAGVEALADEWSDEDEGVEHVAACQDYGCKTCVVIACATDLRALLTDATTELHQTPRIGTEKYRGKS